MDVTQGWKHSPISRALLAAGVLMMLGGAGCRPLEKAWDEYCEQMDCDGGDGDADGGDVPEAGLTIELEGTAVQGECIDVVITTPDDEAWSVRLQPPSAAEEHQSFQEVFAEPGCTGRPTHQLEVPAGTVERRLSIRLYAHQSFESVPRHTRRLELKYGDNEAWYAPADLEIELEYGAFFFGPGEAPSQRPSPDASPAVIPLAGCTKIVGRLFGVDSGRPARYAAGELSLAPDSATAATVSLEPDCDPAYTGDALEDLQLWVPGGELLTLYLNKGSELPLPCELWLVGLDGVADSEIRVEDATSPSCLPD